MSLLDQTPRLPTVASRGHRGGIALQRPVPGLLVTLMPCALRVPLTQETGRHVCDDVSGKGTATFSQGCLESQLLKCNLPSAVARLHPALFWQHGARSKLCASSGRDGLATFEIHQALGSFSRTHFVSSLAIELAPSCEEVIVTV